MNIRVLASRAAVLTAALFAAASAPAESFAVRTFHSVTMDALENVKAVLQVGDGLLILLPAERSQLQSIEVEIKVPAVVASAKEAAVFCFYGEVTAAQSPEGDFSPPPPLPPSGTANASLNGKALYRSPLPNRVGLNLAVPYGNFVIQSTPYLQVLPVAADAGTTALFLHLAPTANVSQAILDALLYVTVKPRVEDRGFLELSITYPKTGTAAAMPKNAAPYLLFIDERPTSEGRIPLDSGVHHLSLVSDYFRNEMRTFSIERGKTARLDVELRDISPTVIVVSPSDAEVFLDDRPLQNGAPGMGSTPLAVTVGIHQLRVIISGYELHRSFHAENGRTYKIAIRLDLDIQENR